MCKPLYQDEQEICTALSNNLAILLTFDFVISSCQVNHGYQEIILYLFYFSSEVSFCGEINYWRDIFFSKNMTKAFHWYT